MPSHSQSLGQHVTYWIGAHSWSKWWHIFWFWWNSFIVIRTLFKLLSLSIIFGLYLTRPFLIYIFILALGYRGWISLQKFHHHSLAISCLWRWQMPTLLGNNTEPCCVFSNQSWVLSLWDTCHIWHLPINWPNSDCWYNPQCWSILLIQSFPANLFLHILFMLLLWISLTKKMWPQYANKDVQWPWPPVAHLRLGAFNSLKL